MPEETTEPIGVRDIITDAVGDALDYLISAVKDETLFDTDRIAAAGLILEHSRNKPVRIYPPSFTGVAISPPSDALPWNGADNFTADGNTRIVGIPNQYGTPQTTDERTIPTRAFPTANKAL